MHACFLEYLISTKINFSTAPKVRKVRALTLESQAGGLHVYISFDEANNVHSMRWREGFIIYECVPLIHPSNIKA